MTSLNNYSKWDNIQLSSDDDEDCHPNIEKFTWRRLRAQQREQKRVEEDQENEKMKAEIKALQQKILELQQFPSTAQTQSAIATHEGKIKQMEEYMAKKERLRKLTPEDLCQDAFNSTKVNKNADLEHATPPALQKKMERDTTVDPEEFSSWHDQHNGLLVEYLACETMEASRDCVKAHPELLNSNATGWILLKALELEMAGDSDGMQRAVRQNQFLQYPMDLSKLTNQAPSAAAKSFFGACAHGRVCACCMSSVTCVANLTWERCGGGARFSVLLRFPIGFTCA